MTVEIRLVKQNNGLVTMLLCAYVLGCTRLNENHLLAVKWNYLKYFSILAKYSYFSILAKYSKRSKRNMEIDEINGGLVHLRNVTLLRAHGTTEHDIEFWKQKKQAWTQVEVVENKDGPSENAKSKTRQGRNECLMIRTDWGLWRISVIHASLEVRWHGLRAGTR